MATSGTICVFFLVVPSGTLHEVPIWQWVRLHLLAMWVSLQTTLFLITQP